jgi:hypothetical protein
MIREENFYNTKKGYLNQMYLLEDSLALMGTLAKLLFFFGSNLLLSIEDHDARI